MVIRVEFILLDGRSAGISELRVLRREPKMGGFFRFLLGGVLGAALGIAVSRKLAPAPRKKTVPGVRFGERPGAPLMSPVGVPTAPPPTAAPAPTVEMPIAVPPATAPPTVPPAAAPPAVAPPVEGLGPTVHEPVAPPVFVTPVPQPVPSDEEISQFAAEAATLEEVTGFEEVTQEVSEIVVTPEVLEEPVPGTGWSSSEVLEEEAIESVLPVIPEEVLPEVPVEVGESVALPEVEATEATVESPAPASPAPASPPTPVVEIPTGEDLRARIEATRRRIREELERPFIADVEIEGLTSVSPHGPVPSSGPLSPVSAPAVPAEEATKGPDEMPVSPRLPAPAVASVTAGEEPEQEGTASSPSAVMSAPASAETVTELSEAPPAGDSLISPDYETIRARIELTRSRLKAKAFDALMAGESALLGRDPAGVRPQPVKVEGVDGDIEQTIETTLREQED